MTRWQYLRVTWSGSRLKMSEPWGDLYLPDHLPPATWDGVARDLGSRGWELVAITEDVRRQVVNGSSVSGELEKWTETYKRPSDDESDAEEESARAALQERVANEPQTEFQGTQRYVWLSGGFACTQHRVDGCDICGPPAGHVRSGSSWVRVDP